MRKRSGAGAWGRSIVRLGLTMRSALLPDVRQPPHLGAGGPFLLGDTLSMADLQLLMYMRWSRNMPKPATAWPNIARYLARMRAMPSLREVHAREGLTDWIDG